MATLRRTLGVFGVILLLMVEGLGMIRRQPAESSYFLAFISDADGSLQLWSMFPDGSHAMRLSNVKSDPPWQVAWSPDARWLAYQSAYRIYITPSAEQKSYLVTPETMVGQAVYPIWSLDSKKVFYTFFPDSRDSSDGIYRVQVNNRRVENIANTTQINLYGLLAANYFNDGTFLAQAYYRSNSNLYRVSENGKILQQLTHDEDFTTPLNLSPNAEWILFEQRNKLYRMRSDGTDKLYLASAENGFNMGTVQWSPDGQWIMFIAKNNDQTKLYRISLEGTNLLQLSNDAETTIGSFQWSPDSQWIAYAGDEAVYKVRWDGTQYQKISPDHYCPFESIYNLQWSYDTKWLTFVRDSQDCSRSDRIYRMQIDGSHYKDISPQGSIDDRDLLQSPIVDIKWHSSILAALGCGAIVLSFSHKVQRKRRTF